MLGEMESLDPKTPEEKLLAAYSAFYVSDPILAIEMLESSWKERRISLNRLVLARARIEAAAQTGELEYMDGAVDDLRSSIHMLGLEGIVGLEVNIAAIQAVALLQDRPEQSRELAEFEQLLSKVTQNRDLEHSMIWQIMAARQAYRDSPEVALEILRRIKFDFASDFFSVDRVALEIELNTERDLSEQLSADALGSFGRYGLGLLAASRGNVEEAHRIAQSMLADFTTQETVVCAANVLDAIGCHDEAVLHIRKYLAEEHNSGDRWSRWQREHLLPYYLDGDEAKLLKAARGSDYKNRWLAYSYEQLGYVCLGKGGKQEGSGALPKCRSLPDPHS